jgi:hypothetical protein
MPRTRLPSDASAAAAALDRWLAAEQSGLDADAEAALAEVLGALPQPAPRAGFADRVLVRAMPGPRRRWLGAGALGLAAAASLLLAALGLAPALRTLLGRASVSGMLQGGIDSIMSLGRWFAGLVSLVDKLLLLARAVAEPLATPPVAVLAGACLLMSVLALRFLCDLIQRDRRWVYVDPI